MPLYTFYPCAADGTSATFVSLELQDDGEAQVRALSVLEKHPTSCQVVVWDGERRVFARSGVHPDLRALLSRRPRPDGQSRRFVGYGNDALGHPA